MPSGLRRASRGKFEGGMWIDQYLYSLSLEESDEIGDVSEMGFAYSGVVLTEDDIQQIKDLAREQDDKLTPAEEDFIREQYGAILEEDDQGFVGVDWIETKAEYDKQWAKAEAAVEEAEEELSEEVEED